MVKVFDGNLFDSEADIIAHSCNLKGRMGSGVAKQIREKYPEAFEQYLKYYKSFSLGDVQFITTKDGKTIANIFGQNDYGYDGKQYTDIEALRKCFENLRMFCSFKNLSIAMPYKIGCVRGGANWDEVYAIIEEVFKDCNVELWRLDKG